MAITAVEFAGINAAFGQFALEIASELNEQQTYVSLQSVEELGINLVTGIRDEMQYAIPFTNSILQKGKQTSFNPVENVVDFIPRTWKMRPWEVNLSFDRRGFDQTFLQHYKSPSRSIEASDSLNEFCLTLLMQQLKEDMETAIWQGVYNPAPAALNVAEPLEVMNGFLELIRLAIISGDITAPVVTGAITVANAIDSFQNVYLGLSPKLQLQPSLLYASIGNVMKFMQNYTALNGENSVVIKYMFEQWLSETKKGNFAAKVPAIPLPLSGGTCIIQPVWGMGDSDRLICATQTKNGGLMSVGMGDEKDLMGFSVDKDHRNLDIMMDGAIACQIGLFELKNEVYISVNDQL